MLLAILFWVVLVIAALTGAWAWWPTSRQSVGAWFLMLVLLFFVGVRLFPISLR